MAVNSFLEDWVEVTISAIWILASAAIVIVGVYLTGHVSAWFAVVPLAGFLMFTAFLAL